MKTVNRFLWSLCLAALIVLVAGARASAAPISVAILGAPATATWNNDVQAKLLSTGQFSTVDIYNTATTTPTLAQLLTYASVLVYSDTPFQNAVTLGNNLADYVDAGGGVVMAVFAEASVPIAGRFVSGGYLLINPTGQQQPANLTLGTFSNPEALYLQVSLPLMAEAQVMRVPAALLMAASW